MPHTPAPPDDEGPRLLHDLGTDRPILMSPRRKRRPRNTGPGADGTTDCPFCGGNERATPPEVDAEREPGTAPDTPGWQSRAFANLYPASDCHEVIAEGAAHTEHPAELDAATLHAALRVWRRRIAAFEARPDVTCAFLFKNVGAAAGASIAHNHTQLLGLAAPPPRLQSELRACRAHGCIHCDEVARAEREDRVITRTAWHVLLSPSTPKLPYEVWLLPTAHAADFAAADHDDDLVAILSATFGCLQRAFDGAAFNLVLHRLPGEDFHWHVELQPRLGNVAALELGGDMYINAVTAAEAAARWRAGS